jgi:uncharacterized protein (DUF342 family)
MAQEPADMPKLSYIGSQLKIKLEITKEQATKNPVPKDIIERARTKMENLKTQRELEAYIIYEDKLTRTWSALKESNYPQDKKIILTLGEGAPKLPGVNISVRAQEDDKNAVFLTIKAHKTQILQWKPDWIEFWIHENLRVVGDQTLASSAQIYGTYLKALSGEPVEKSPIALISSIGVGVSQDKPYSLIANRIRQEIVLVVRDPEAFLEQTPVKDFLPTIDEAVQKIAKQFGVSFFFFKKEVTAWISNLASTYHILGLDLPVTCLVASYVDPKLTTDQKPTSTYPGAGKLKLFIQEDALSAEIVQFNESLYEDPNFVLDEAFLIQELTRYGIVKECYENNLTHIKNLLLRKSSLNGMTIALGDPGNPGKMPYLRPTYKESFTQDNEPTPEDNVDLRSLQQRNIVTQGQLIAEVCYSTPPRTGQDIFGTPLEPLHSEPLNVDVGEGAKRVGNSFYATQDGMPYVDRDRRKVYVLKNLVHKGDVNLKTGHIIFQGSVEVTGSIDFGSYVEVKGNLIVQGSIRGGMVRCSGHITVLQGIVTGLKGYVIGGGQISAEFIENSRIECAQDLTVRKAIINSRVISGGSIHITEPKTGVLGGGQISCRENIFTANFAFKNGANTVLYAGVDAKIKKRLDIRQLRLKNITEAKINDEKSLEELLGRKQHEKNIKLQEKKDLYQKRIKKEIRLIRTLENLVKEAEAQLTYNETSKVLISNFAYANSQIFIGGHQVPLNNDIAAIGIIAKKKNGKKIVTIEEALEMLEKEKNKAAESGGNG